MRAFKNNSFPTVGVEQEFHLIDGDSAELTPRIHDVAVHMTPLWRKKATSELFRSVLETQSGVHKTVDSLAEEVVAVRQHLAEACGRGGVLYAAAGSHPFSDWRREEFIQTEHYAWVKQQHGYLIHKMLAYGLHVHVGMPDGDCAVYVMNEMRRWLYPLLGLSANSPFQHGMDTGLSSTRMHLFLHLPRTGMPPHFSSFKEVEILYEKLKAAGDVVDPDSLWWLMRPQPIFGTLEFRVFDLPTDYRRLCALAAIVQAASAYYIERYKKGVSASRLNVDYLLENQWKAMRFGIDGVIIEPETGEVLPTRTQFERLFELIAPVSERLQSSCYMDVAKAMLKEGTEADWQREFATRHSGDLRALELEIARRTVGDGG